MPTPPLGIRCGCQNPWYPKGYWYQSFALLGETQFFESALPERTRECYLILYTWKIIKSLVPNQCNLASLHSRKTPNFLNSLPAYLRNLTDIPIQKFKKRVGQIFRMNLGYPNTRNIQLPHSLVDQIQYHIRRQASHTSNGQR